MRCSGGFGLRRGLGRPCPAEAQGRPLAVIGEFDLDVVEAGGCAVLDGHDDLLVAAPQVQVAVAPGMELRGAAQGLARSRGAALAGVVDQQDGGLEAALEIAQEAEDALEQRRRFLSDGGLPAVIVGAAPDPAAQTIGIAAPVERIEGTQALAAPAVDQIDARQVPARDTQMQLAQVPPRRRHLVADALDRHGAVRAPDPALHGDAEGRPESAAVRAGPRRVVALHQATLRLGRVNRLQEGPPGQLLARWLGGTHPRTSVSTGIPSVILRTLTRSSL